MIPTRHLTRFASGCIATALLTCCAACTSTAPAGPDTPAAPATSSAPPSSASPATGSSAAATARAERMRIDAALGHRVVSLEYLCSVPSEGDADLDYVALHERTTWQESGRTASLDAVLAQPVRSTGSGRWAAAGSPVAIRSVRNGRLASDAIVGLVGPDHRCSASYIGPPVTG